MFSNIVTRNILHNLNKIVLFVLEQEDYISTFYGYNVNRPFSLQPQIEFKKSETFYLCWDVEKNHNEYISGYRPSFS